MENLIRKHSHDICDAISTSTFLQLLNIMAMELPKADHSRFVHLANTLMEPYSLMTQFNDVVLKCCTRDGLRKYLEFLGAQPKLKRIFPQFTPQPSQETLGEAPEQVLREAPKEASKEPSKEASKSVGAAREKSLLQLDEAFRELITELVQYLAKKNETLLQLRGRIELPRGTLSRIFEVDAEQPRELGKSLGTLPAGKHANTDGNTAHGIVHSEESGRKRVERILQQLKRREIIGRYDMSLMRALLIKEVNRPNYKLKIAFDRYDKMMQAYWPFYREHSCAVCMRNDY